MKLTRAHKALLLIALLSISANAVIFSFLNPPAQAFITYNYIIFDTWTNQTDQTVSRQYYGANSTVLLTFNASAYSSYERADLGNIRFFRSIPPNQPLPAWIESWSGNTTNDANTATSVKVWVNLENTGLYASDVWIWMVFFDPATIDFNSNPTIAGWPSASMGEAPQLSSSYGQFDNGGDVFLFYDNFAGSSINALKWNATGASYSVSNGLTFNQNSNYNLLTSLVNISYGAPNLLYPNGEPEYPLVEYYGSGTSSTSDSGVFYGLASSNANSNGYLWSQRGSSPANDSLSTYTSGSYTLYKNGTYSLDGTNHIYGIGYGKSYYVGTYQMVTYTDYAVKLNSTSLPTTYLNNPFFSFRDTVAATSLSVTWVRARPFPPNGMDFNAAVMSSYLTSPRVGFFIDNQKIQESVSQASGTPQNPIEKAIDQLLNATGNAVLQVERLLEPTPKIITPSSPNSKNPTGSMKEYAGVLYTVTTYPSGVTGGLTIDGVTYTGSQKFLWNMGDTHNITANNAAGYKFFSWSDGGARSHIITVGSTGTYTATYNGTGIAPVIIQTGQCGGNGALQTCTLTGAVGAGDYILLEMSAASSTGMTVTNIMDSLGNTYHLINSTIVSSYTHAWDYYTVTGAGASDHINVTFSNPSDYGYGIFATELAGVSGVLGSATGGTSSGGSFSTQSLTSPPTPSVMFAFGGQLATSLPSWTAGANYTTSQSGYFGTYNAMMDQYNLTWPTSTATTAPMTSTSTSYSWADIVVSLAATPWYYVTFATDGHGTVNQTSDWMVNGTNVIVLASPNANYAFLNFVNSVNGNFTSNPYALTVTGNMTITAYFNSTYTPPLSVNVTVTTSPPLPSSFTVDGVTYTGPATFTWNPGDSHTITAAGAVNDWQFSSWSDGGAQTHTVAPTATATYTATYIEQGPTGTPYQPPSNETIPPSSPPLTDTNGTVTVTPGGGSSTTTISIPQGYALVNSSIESTCPGVDVLSYPSGNGTVTIKATAENGAMSGLCRVGIALTMKDAYGRIITQKYLLGVDVEALGAVPWANWFAWFLIGLFAIMLLGATQQKKGR